ncbi:MAG: hypothetical protein ABI834_07590 [Ginsengibacter sp.]
MLIIKKQIIDLLLIIIASFYFPRLIAQPKSEHNLKFDSLAKRWDEGIPLGNGWLGALVWQKGNNIRVSLDRVDLWDDRGLVAIASSNSIHNVLLSF